MRVTHHLTLPRDDLAAIVAGVPRFTVLGDLLAWGFRQSPRLEVLEVVVQDEYTHDVVLSWRDGLVLVYDST
jgi:hypothetical protein